MEKNPWMYTTIILSVISIILAFGVVSHGECFFTGMVTNLPTNQPSNNTGNVSGTQTQIETQGLTLLAVYDPDCKVCDYQGVINYFKEQISDLKIKELNYKENQGRNLIESLEIKRLPAILFTKEIKDNSIYSNLQRWLTEKGDYYLLSYGQELIDLSSPETQVTVLKTSSDTSLENTLLRSLYSSIPNLKVEEVDSESSKGQSLKQQYNINPLALIITSSLEDIKDSLSKGILGNLEQKEINGKIIITIPKSNKVNLKLFVMAFCPFGKQMESVVYPVAQLLGDKLEVEPHFVIYGTRDNPSSMHGEYELIEAERQLCIIDEYGVDSWWNYVNCLNKKHDEMHWRDDKDSPWRECAQNASLDIQKIENCVNTKGLPLVQKEYDACQEYGVSGSPTVYLNGFLLYQGQRTPEALKQQICSLFEEEPEECSTTLSGGGSSPSGMC